MRHAAMLAEGGGAFLATLGALSDAECEQGVALTGVWHVQGAAQW